MCKDCGVCDHEPVYSIDDRIDEVLEITVF
jgi:hypothetical protein